VSGKSVFVHFVEGNDIIVSLFVDLLHYRNSSPKTRKENSVIIYLHIIMSYMLWNTETYSRLKHCIDQSETTAITTCFIKFI